MVVKHGGSKVKQICLPLCCGTTTAGGFMIICINACGVFSFCGNHSAVLDVEALMCPGCLFHEVHVAVDS